jgi:hypothetical protein
MPRDHHLLDGVPNRPPEKCHFADMHRDAFDQNINKLVSIEPAADRLTHQSRQPQIGWH